MMSGAMIAGAEFFKREIFFDGGLNGIALQQVDHLIVRRLINKSVLKDIEVVAQLDNDLLFMNIIGFGLFV